jgi:hypothetical protein
LSRRDKNVPPIVLFGQAVPIWVMVNLLGLDGVRLRRELSRTKTPSIEIKNIFIYLSCKPKILIEDDGQRRSFQSIKGTFKH